MCMTHINSIRDVFQQIDFDKMVKMMNLIDDIKKEKPLDEIIQKYPFNLVYGIVATYEKHKKGMDKSLRKPANILYNKIKEQYPIEKFPEKYI
jgi:hypothetical protein